MAHPAPQSETLLTNIALDSLPESTTPASTISMAIKGALIFVILSTDFAPEAKEKSDKLRHSRSDRPEVVVRERGPVVSSVLHQHVDGTRELLGILAGAVLARATGAAVSERVDPGDHHTHSTSGRTASDQRSWAWSGPPETRPGGRGQAAGAESARLRD